MPSISVCPLTSRRPRILGNLTSKTFSQIITQMKQESHRQNFEGATWCFNTHSTNRSQVRDFVLSNLILCFIFQSIFCLQCTKQPICPIQNKMQNYLQNPEMKPRAREKNDAALPNRGLALNRQHLTANDK